MKAHSRVATSAAVELGPLVKRESDESICGPKACHNSTYVDDKGQIGGAAIAWLAFDGRDMWVWGAFKLRVSPALWLLGLAWALTTSLLGGLLPALRAGRLPPSEAVRVH